MRRLNLEAADLEAVSHEKADLEGGTFWSSWRFLCSFRIRFGTRLQGRFAALGATLVEPFNCFNRFNEPTSRRIVRRLSIGIHKT
jgi:hypothetical protein